MFVKMGFKKWTRGTQAGIRVYSPSIKELARILTLPSHDKRWRTLGDFIYAVFTTDKRTGIRPYSRKIKIVSNNMKKYLQVTLTIAQHDHSTQGYITIPENSWVFPIVKKNIDRNFVFEYIAGKDEDMLILPNFKVNIEKQREYEHEKLEKTATRKLKRVPIGLDKIGLYFELKEVEYIKQKEKLIPSHRYPLLESRKIESIPDRSISCDIDVFDKDGKFIKFVEVKSIYGTSGTGFPLTVREYESREKCRKSGWDYKIVIYYHIGKHILERKIIPVSKKLDTIPLSYWCEY